MSKAFFIFIIIAVFVVVAAVAWFSNHSEIGKTNANTNAANVNSDNTADFTLLQSADTITNGAITTYTFAAGNVLNVMPADMQSVTLAETPVQERTPITIGAVSGERITITSAKDGSAQTIVQVVHNDKLYDFRGSADFLDHLADYIQFN